MVTACGSSDSGSTESTASNSGSSGGLGPVAEAAFKKSTGLPALTGEATLEELKPRVEKFEETPQKLLVTEPVSKKAEPGKVIADIRTDLPQNVEFLNAITDAAKLLGWTVERIDQGASPQEFAQAYDQAIQMKPDLVIGSGLPREYFDKQLDELASMNIPVIEWSTDIEPVPGHLWGAVGQATELANGMMTAEFLASESEMKGGIVTFAIPQYSVNYLYAKTIQDQLGVVCPGCSAELVDAGVNDVGQLGPKVVAYLEQNPDTKYVVCAFGDMCTGVASALRAAGKGDVKIFTHQPSTTNLQQMANGFEWAANPLPTDQTGWQVIDLAQRIFNGDDTTDTDLQPIQIVTDVTDPKSPTIGAVSDYQEKYKKLWRLDE